MKILYLITALTITCTEWNGIRTCTGPGGYRSTESTWNGITTGRDNNSTWKSWNWNGRNTIQVTPKR